MTDTTSQMNRELLLATGPTNPLVYTIGFDESGVPLQIAIPTGGHYYYQKTWVGSTALGDTPEAAFEALRRAATPYQMGVRIDVDGQVTEIPGLGGVTHKLFEDQMTIVNSTLENHVLDPGNVWRQVVQEGDNIYIVTRGYGQGMLPDLNKKWGPACGRASMSPELEIGCIRPAN